MIRFLGLAFIVSLGACAPHANLAQLPEGTKPAAIIPVLTATNRLAPEDGPGTNRSEQTTFSRIDIAVPPKRQAGDFDFASRSVDPETQFLVDQYVTYADARGFRRALSQQLRALPRSERDVLIFVHGFNNNFADGVLRMGQLTHDLALKGAAVHFSWPSGANPLAYAYDRDSALFSRDALQELIDLVQVPEARRVAIIAHSMGAFLTMETLRQMAIAAPGSVRRNIDGVVLISPDLDVDLFHTQARRIGPLPETFAVFLSDKDRALGLSARLTGTRDRLGNLQDPTRIAEFDVTLVDVTAFSSGDGHLTPITSPPLIRILSSAAAVNNAFASDAAGMTGLIPGSVLTIQNVTEYVLTAGGG